MGKIKRNSNIELFRIIAMFFITQAHFLFNATEAAPFITQNLSNVLSLGGAFGVNAFILITCYFMVEKPFMIKRITGVIKPVLFYSMLLALPWLFITRDLDKVIGWFVRLPGQYWFVTAYIILIVLIPIMDWFLKRMTKRQVLVVKWLTFFATTLLPGLIGIDLGPLRMSVFIYLYIFSYYLKKYDVKHYNIKVLVWVIIISIVVYLAVYSYSVANMLDVSIFTFVPQKHLQNNIFQVFIVCNLFKIVIKTKSFYNENINQISKSVFAAYLIQQHGSVVALRQSILMNIYIDNFLLSVITHAITALILLMMFIAVDQLIKKFINI